MGVSKWEIGGGKYATDIEESKGENQFDFGVNLDPTVGDGF